MSAPQTRLLDDGKRLHLHWGPIDLIIEAFGDPVEVLAAYDQAVGAFAPVLPELADELAYLRSAQRQDWTQVKGQVAREMAKAARAHAGFVTPMAGVAGAVADHMLQAVIKDRELDRAYVNNGGDCALYLKPGEAFDLAAPAGGGGAKIRIGAGEPVRGVATSGWRGRSWSLGIADAVTVLAATAVEADLAATLIAGAVDLPGHRAISRVPATELDPDSDLGERAVTTAVGALSSDEIARALSHGVAHAQGLLSQRRISGALLSLHGETREVSDKPLALTVP